MCLQVIYEIFEGFLMLEDASQFAMKAAGYEHVRPECHMLNAMGLKRTERMAAVIKRCWCASHGASRRLPRLLSAVDGAPTQR